MIFFRWKELHPENPRLTAGELRNYLSRAHELTKEQIAEDSQAMGLVNKGKGYDIPYMHFINHRNKIRLEIHPPHSKTPYDHMHIFNKDGKSLDVNLRIVKSNSPDAHIPIKPSGNPPIPH